MLNVGKYTIHGWYGVVVRWWWHGWMYGCVVDVRLPVLDDVLIAKVFM